MTQQTNTEFMHDLMEFSSVGGLVQAFVLEALDKYAAQVLEWPEAVREQMNNDGLIAYEPWARCAAEVRKKIARHLGRDRS